MICYYFVEDARPFSPKPHIADRDSLRAHAIAVASVARIRNMQPTKQHWLCAHCIEVSAASITAIYAAPQTRAQTNEHFRFHFNFNFRLLPCRIQYTQISPLFGPFKVILYNRAGLHIFVYIYYIHSMLRSINKCFVLVYIFLNLSPCNSILHTSVSRNM